MEVFPRKLPPFPSSYVTIAQLQERWTENKKRTQNKGEQLQPETKHQEPRANKETEGPEAKSEGAVCIVSSKITDKKTRGSKKLLRKRKGKKVKETKRDDEQVTTGDTLAPKTSGEEEEKEKAKSGNVIVADQTVEIEGRLKGMSIKRGGERGNDKLTRPYRGGSHRGGNRSYRGSYGRFDKGSRREERDPRNAGMIWVKKGDTSGGNADEVQGPDCL